MPPLKEVMVAPFFRDVDEYDCKLLELERDATCGDIIAAIAQELGFRRRDLALMGSKAGVTVRFHSKEPPMPFMQVKGIEDFSSLPQPMKVKSKKRTELTYEEAIQIQDELLAAYSSEVFVLMMNDAKKKCKQKWKEDGDTIDTKDYNLAMKSVLEYAQEQVLPKWGYEANARGMLDMQFHFSPWDPFPEVSSRVDLTQKKIGFDYTWISEDDHIDAAISDRNFGQGGKMKMLYLYGGGVNSAVARMQWANVFKDVPLYREMEFAVLEAPHKGNLKWHGNPIMQQSLKPYGETIHLYFDRVPYANCQYEAWEGIEDALSELKEHLRMKGPYDGVVGFDMGGEVLLQAARLQQEGERGWKGMFRFMVLFTSATARHLSDLGRPKEPLQIPAVISWSNKDENHSYTMYQETALYFDARVREVITHGYGHMPPRWNKVTDAEPIDRLGAFLDAMYTGNAWAPSRHSDNEWCKDLQLPMVSVAPKPLPAATQKRLLVVHDPMGAHDYPERLEMIRGQIKQGMMPGPQKTLLYKTQGIPDWENDMKMNHEVSMLTAELFRAAGNKDVIIEAVEYSEAQRSHNWHVPDKDIQPVKNHTKKEDIIDGDAAKDHEVLATSWASDIIQRSGLGENERLGIVGLGTGAFIAFAIAKILAKQREQPLVGLWLVDPPTILPTPTTQQPGALAACPVRVLVHDTSTVGPPWCYETSTRGPFSQTVFKRTEELAWLVTDDYSTLCEDGELEWQRLQVLSQQEQREKEEEECIRQEKEKARRQAEEAFRREAEEWERQEAAAAAERAKAAEELGRQKAAAAEEQARQEAAAAEERAKAAEAHATWEAKLRSMRQAHESAAPTISPGAAAESRCTKELARSPKSWVPVTMEKLQANHMKMDPGMFYGLDFPWNAELLEQMGPAWLTKAFHTAGTIPQDNGVRCIKNVKEFVGGGAASKFIFDIEYEKAAPELHTKLFAKVPFPLSDKTRADRMSASVMLKDADFNEININRLLESRWPFRIPRYYFGDISNETTNWILITERIPFGEQEGPIKFDVAYDKMKDYELLRSADEYYYLLVQLGGQMAGMYKAGKLAPLELLHSFLDPCVRPKPEMWFVHPGNTGISDNEFKAKIRMAEDFIEKTGRVVFPAACSSPEFIRTYSKLMAGANAYTAEAQWWCHRDPDYIALSHANINIDNAFFWQDEDEELHAGLLDWGGASCGSMGWKLWLWLYCCEYPFLQQELDGLIKCFIEEYYVNGGPLLNEGEIRWHFQLSALAQGVQLLGAIPMIYRMCPKKNWPSIQDRYDPRIAQNIDGKNTLRIYIGTLVNICSMIKDWDIESKFQRWEDEVTAALGMPRKALRAT